MSPAHLDGPAVGGRVSTGPGAVTAARMRGRRRTAGIAVGAVLGVATAVVAATPAAADNRRLNDSVVSNVSVVQGQAGCTGDLKVDPKLRLAAQWHTNDVLNNRALDGDIGSDGSTPQQRGEAAGFRGRVSETVAINPALAISSLELINKWYHRPDYLAIMRDCANTAIGVWSENRLDRTVVVAVYGAPA